MAKSVFILVLLLITTSTISMAHSVRINVELHPPVVKVHAFFSANAPLADAKVEVFAPGSDRIYQRGRTDPGGFFAFIPSTAGEWQVRIDDERGHRGNAVASIHPVFLQPDQVHARAVAPATHTPEQYAYETPVPSGDEALGEAGYETPVPSGDEAPGEAGYDTPGQTGREIPGQSGYKAPLQAGYEIPLLYRVIFGLALIFGLTGFFYGVKARKSIKNKE